MSEIETTAVRFSALPCLIPIDAIEWIEDVEGAELSILHMLSGSQHVVRSTAADIEASIRKSYPGWALKTVEVGDTYEIHYQSGNSLIFKVEEIRERVAYAVDCFVPLRDLIRGSNDQLATFTLTSREKKP
jgi:hypothetical protein